MGRLAVHYPRPRLRAKILSSPRRELFLANQLITFRK